MTDEELHKIAKKTAIYGIHSDGEWVYSFYIEPLQAFAKLIAERERTWVDLTNDELTDLFYNTNLGQQSAVGQAIALLKEKNAKAN